jgi:hypothetical protein
MDELLAEIERLPESVFTMYPTYAQQSQLFAHARRIALLAFEAAARECDEHEPEHFIFTENRTAAKEGAADCATAIRAMAALLGE